MAIGLSINLGANVDRDLVYTKELDDTYLNVVLVQHARRLNTAKSTSQTRQNRL